MRGYRKIVIIVVLILVGLLVSGCQESNESKYNRAQKLLSEAKYDEAIKVFEEISTYEDASKMTMYAKALSVAESGDYQTAIANFNALGDFKDCPMMITYYTARQYESQASADNWSSWNSAAKTYDTISLFLDSKERAENCRKASYDLAIKSGDEGNTSLAILLLKELGSYSDAEKQAAYYQAVALLNQGDYSGASCTFSTIRGFRDADNRVTTTMEDGYKAAEVKEESGELDEANTIFLNLGDYKDSAERAYKLYYDAGLAKREAGDWDGAIAAFTKAADYSDAETQISETKYQHAKSLMNAGDYNGAVVILMNLKGYRDTDNLLASDDNLIAAATIISCQTVGSYVSFGTYPQTSKGTDQTPIEWLVLDYDEANHRSLLLSRYGLIPKPYNTGLTETNWEKCTLRTWLNSVFVNNAFNEKERSAILITDLNNWNSGGGIKTQDRVFLLSREEAKHYLDVTNISNNEAGICADATGYAIKLGAWTNGHTKTGEWWLRSSGSNLRNAIIVSNDGSIRDCRVDLDDNVVRPAFWINLESDIF